MRRNKRISVTPTVDTDAYTAGDVVGGLMTFAVGGVGLSGSIRSVIVVDDHGQTEPYTLYWFYARPSTIADDAAFAPTVADLKKLATTLLLEAGDYATVNSNDVAILGGREDSAMDVPFTSDDGNLYLYAVPADTPDYNAATDLTFILTVRIDD